MTDRSISPAGTSSAEAAGDAAPSVRVYFLDLLRESRVDRELRNPFFIVAMIFALVAGGVALALWAETSPARWIGPRSLWWLGGYLLVILAGSWAIYRWRRVRNEKRLAIWEERARASAARPGTVPPDWIAALWLQRESVGDDAESYGPKFPPAVVMCVDLPELSVIRAADQRFEPVQLAAEPERAEILAAENEDRRGPSTGRVAAAERRAKAAANERVRSRRLWQWLGSLLFLGWMLGNLLLNGSSWAVVAGAALGIGVPALIRRLSTGRNGLYLIPGGLVLREGNFLQPHRLTRYDARWCGMTLSEATGADVLMIELHWEHGTRTFPAPAEVAPGLLAGWLSTAPPPTDAQLAEFLGLSGMNRPNRAV